MCAFKTQSTDHRIHYLDTKIRRAQGAVALISLQQTELITKAEYERGEEEEEEIRIRQDPLTFCGPRKMKRTGVLD